MVGLGGSRPVVLGTVGGTQVRMHIGAPLALLVISGILAGYLFPTLFPHWSPALCWLAGASVALLELGAGLLHEAGHAWVARAHGQRVHSVTFYGVAARTARTGAGAAAREQLLTAIAGPLSHFLFAAVLFGMYRLLPDSELGTAVLGLAALSNLLMGVLNSLPIPPLDGGRAMRALLGRTVCGPGGSG